MKKLAYVKENKNDIWYNIQEPFIRAGRDFRKIVVGITPEEKKQYAKMAEKLEGRKGKHWLDAPKETFFNKAKDIAVPDNDDQEGLGKLMMIGFGLLASILLLKG